MSASRRWLLALAAAILVAGVVGAAVHTSPSHRVTFPPATTVARPPGSTSTTIDAPVRSTTTEPSGPPGAGSATLQASLLVANDLGGFFRIEPAEGASFLASAPCLAGLAPAPSQSGRAVTGLVDSTYGSLPEIVEVVTSYPGDQNLAVYHAVLTTLGACRNFTAAIGGSEISVAMAAAQMPEVGQVSTLYQGEFTHNGRTEQLGVGLAADNRDVVLVAYLDTVPPTSTFFGGVQATLSDAIGKEA